MAMLTLQINKIDEIMTKKVTQHCLLASTHMHTCVQVLGHTQILTEKEKGQGEREGLA